MPATTRPASASVEDYAKAIYSLEEAEDAPVTTTAIAQRLCVTPGSASAMVKKLAELGLATHTPYRGVRLTTDGRRVALEVIRHHRLLELFLADVLGMPWDRVHAEAEVLEHVISEELEALIAAKLGHPTLDPHGSPIPSEDFSIAAQVTCALEDLLPGDTGRLARVTDANPEMLRYLAQRGIAPGDEFDVLDRQPFGGPLTVRFGDPHRGDRRGAGARDARRRHGLRAATRRVGPSAGRGAGSIRSSASGAIEIRLSTVCGSWPVLAACGGSRCGSSPLFTDDELPPRPAATLPHPMCVPSLSGAGACRRSANGGSEPARPGGPGRSVRRAWRSVPLTGTTGTTSHADRTRPPL
jgi:DtxR family Mn-dependent transcriptional regulator